MSFQKRPHFSSNIFDVWSILVNTVSRNVQQKIFSLTGYILGVPLSINSLLLRMREEIFWLTVHRLASVSSQEPPAIIHLWVLPQHPPPQHSHTGQALSVEPLEGSGSNPPEFSWPPHSGASSCFPAHPFSFLPKCGSPQMQDVSAKYCLFLWDPVLCATLHLRGSRDLREIAKGQGHSHHDLYSRCFF